MGESYAVVSKWIHKRDRRILGPIERSTSTAQPRSTNPTSSPKSTSHRQRRGPLVRDPNGEFPIKAPEVTATFASYDPAVRAELLVLRHLILATADETAGVGRIEETLKWGQPSYLTTQTHSGSTVRIAPTKSGSDGDYAMFFICHTNLVERFRIMFGDTLTYDADRALLFSLGTELPENEIRQCVTMALTYHLTKS